MEAIHLQRLETLAEALEQGRIEHKQFYFGQWNADEDHEQLESNGCGFCGCAIGQCPSVFPEQWEWKNGVPLLRIQSDHSAFLDGQIFFSLSGYEFDHLFVPRCQCPDQYGGSVLTRDATAQEVAMNIREFVRRKRRYSGHSQLITLLSFMLQKMNDGGKMQVSN